MPEKAKETSAKEAPKKLKSYSITDAVKSEGYQAIIEKELIKIEKAVNGVSRTAKFTMLANPHKREWKIVEGTEGKNALLGLSDEQVRQLTIAHVIED